VAYQTAYLKAHYPAEYMASLITSEMDNSDKVLRYMQECRDMGIDVLPPDVNESMRDFTVAAGGVRFGMAAVKGVGGSTVDAIIAAREKEGRFASFLGFAESVESSAINRRVAEALIKCGAFDSFGHTRAALIDSVEETLSAAQKKQRDRDIGQFDIFSAAGGEDMGSAVTVRDIPEWPEKERLAYEKEALGFYISGHPLTEYTRDLKLLANFNTATIENASNKAEVRMGGVVISKRTQMTKKGKTMAYLSLEDLSGSIDVLVWPDVYTASVELIESDEPLFIKGTADVDEEKGVKVISQEIMTFPQAKAKFTNSVHVRMSTLGLEKETLMELKGVFERHTGTCPVSLHFQIPGKGEVVIKATGMGVTAGEELVGDIENLVGSESVLME